MKTLYESLLDDEEDMINNEAAVEFELVKSCFDIELFKPGEKSQYLKQKSNGHYVYDRFVWPEMAMNLINLPFEVTFDHMEYLEFNSSKNKEWNVPTKNIKTIFKDINNVVISGLKNLPKWIVDLNIEKCHSMRIYSALDNSVYQIPNTKIDNLKIVIKPHGIEYTLWQADGLELLIGNYKNIDAENVAFCTDQMVISGIMPFNDPRQTDVKMNHLNIDPDNQKEFAKFFSNNPKVKHLYVYISDNSPYLRKSLYYEVLPMKTSGKFKLKKTTLHDENFR